MKASPNKSEVLYKHFAYKEIRQYFFEQNFIEVFTPFIISGNAPDPFIDPIFISSMSSKNHWQLHTSPELYLKESMALGLDKIFQIARVFRDDPLGPIHNIEFDMLEWYRAHGSLLDLMADCQALVKCVSKAASKMYGTDLNPDVIKTTVSKLFHEHVGINLPEIMNQERINPGALSKTLFERNEHLPKAPSFQDGFFHVMLKYVEPNLPKDKVVFIEEWPAPLAALSKISPTDKNFCQRFEMYYQGMELANAYEECNDPLILKKRFDEENLQRKMLKKSCFMPPGSFFHSLEKLPQMSGIALGVDRLILAMSPKRSLEEITFGWNG